MTELLERANELVKRLRSDMDAIKSVIDRVSAFDLAFDGEDRLVPVVAGDSAKIGLSIPSSLLIDSMGGKSEVKGTLLGWLTKYEPMLPEMTDPDYQSVVRMARLLVTRLEDKAHEVTHYINLVVEGMEYAKSIQSLNKEPVSIALSAYSYPNNDATYMVPASSLVEHLAVEMTWRAGQLEMAIGKWESVARPVATAIRQEREIDKLIGEIEAAANEE